MYQPGIVGGLVGQSLVVVFVSTVVQYSYSYYDGAFHWNLIRYSTVLYCTEYSKYYKGNDIIMKFNRENDDR